MKIVLFIISTLLFSCTLAQPPQVKIQSDVKKEIGNNCTLVTITGTGKLVEENENGVWIKYYRVPVNAVLKTELQGVTRLMKGAAVYTLNGGSYLFKKYNTASGEYIGLPAPNLTEIKAFINTLPDLALGGKANIITEVENIDITNSPCKWHTLLSVSMQCRYTYWYKKNNIELEKIIEPFELRLYRKDVNSKWHEAVLIVPDAAYDNRIKEIADKKIYNNEKTIIEKGIQKKAEANFNNLPDVNIPAFASSKDVAIWFNELLLQGNETKAEKAFLTLIHPSQKSSAGSLSSNANDMIVKMKNAANNNFSSYNRQYCSTITIKEQTPQTIEWWNKDKTKFSRIRIQEENGKIYIAEASINLWQSFNAANAQRTTNTNCN